MDCTVPHLPCYIPSISFNSLRFSSLNSSSLSLIHSRMLTYPNRSDQKRRAIIIIYENGICFVTASHYSSCYSLDEAITVFCISIFIYATSTEKKRQNTLISVWSPWMHCIIPVIVPIAVIMQQVIQQFSEKYSVQIA